MDAYSGKSKTEEKRLLLHERREKLRQLLKREKASLEVYSSAGVCGGDIHTVCFVRVS